MYNQISIPALTDITFSSNKADLGGGIYNYLSSPVLTRVTFFGNISTNGGGDIYNEIRNALTFPGNTADAGSGRNNVYSPQKLEETFFRNPKSKWRSEIPHDQDD